MKKQITPAQAEDALDAIKSLKVRACVNRASYAITKNAMVLGRVTRDFGKFRDVERSTAFAPGEKPDPSSEKYAALTAKVAAKAHEEVEVDLTVVKLSELFKVCALEDVTALIALDFILEDDLDLDALEPVK
jgi:hypothetical protein